MSSPAANAIRAVLDTLPPGPVSQHLTETRAQWAASTEHALDWLGEQGALLDGVRAFAVAPMSEALLQSPGRGLLVGELLRHLAVPQRINQGRKATCAPTCVETYLALTAPSEYVRILSGLVSPTGTVELAGGSTLARDGDAPLEWSEPEGTRSPLSRLFQVAAMEAASATWDYDNRSDSQRGADGASHGTGMDLLAFDVLIEAVTGVEWHRWSRAEAGFTKLLRAGTPSIPAPLEPTDLLDVAQAALDAGDAAFATLASSEVEASKVVAAMGNYDPMAGRTDVPSIHSVAHKVRIMAVDREGDLLLFDDPLDPDVSWLGMGAVVEDALGGCSMPLDRFLSCVADFSVREEFWAPPG